MQLFLHSIQLHVFCYSIGKWTKIHSQIKNLRIYESTLDNGDTELEMGLEPHLNPLQITEITMSLISTSSWLDDKNMHPFKMSASKFIV